jgi:hypothetical protein
MFAAFKENKDGEKKNNTDLNWLRNSSYKNEDKKEIIVLSSDDEPIILNTSTSEKKRKKKHKKHKESKQEKNNTLIDKEYLNFFEQFSKKDLKQHFFIDDFDNISLRNAFRIDKVGDGNNICSENVYYKKLSKYKISNDDKSNKNSSNKKKSAKLKAKQQNRYFSSKNRNLISTRTEITKTTTANTSTLSNRLYLYLEMERYFKKSKNIQSACPESKNQDKTSDYNKYLLENKNDVDKWLEFIRYQDNENETKRFIFERKLSIFERALTSNENSIRLHLQHIKLKAKNIEMITSSIDASASLDSEYIYLITKCSSLLINSNYDIKILRDSLSIWLNYIHFQTKRTSPGYFWLSVQSSIKRCFQFYSSKKINNILRSDNFLYNLLINLVNEWTFLLKNAGYNEKELAIWQAVIDFNYFIALNTETDDKNEFSNLNYESRRQFFELFWDTGLKKFGEKRNKDDTWLNELYKKKYSKLNDDRNDEDLNDRQIDNDLYRMEESILDPSNPLNIFKIDDRIEFKWLKMEQDRNLLQWWPFYPNINNGESIDDCIDYDRCVEYEDEINYLLIDINSINNDDYSDQLKFKLFARFLNSYGLITFNEDNVVENDDDLVYFQCDCYEDNIFMNELINNLTILKPSLVRPNSILESMFNQFKLNENDELSQSVYKREIIKIIHFFRNCFQQVIESNESTTKSHRTLKYQNYFLVLKWKLELNLISCLIKNDIIDETESHFFNANLIKNNLLNEIKQCLSLPSNRSNFYLWKEYSILKYILAHITTKDKNKINLKETKKVFETLLTTSPSANSYNDESCIDIFSLCLDYAEIELGLFCR